MLVIGRGKLFRDGGEKHGVTLPPLTYQVRNLAGVPATHNYTGPGTDNGASIMVGRADSCSLAEWKVDLEATPESVDERNGAFARIEVLRAVYPKNASEAFQEGWKDADRQLRTESKAARAARINAIRWAR